MSQSSAPFAQPPEDQFAQSIQLSLTRQRWIAPDGSANNDGKTPETAWPSFDVAFLRKGEWDVLQVLTSAVPYVADVQVNGSDRGSVDKPKVIRGANADGSSPTSSTRPVVNPREQPSGVGRAPFTIASEFWIVEGLNIDGRGLAKTVGVYILSGDAGHVAVRRCTIQNCQASAVQVLDAHHVLIDDNVLMNNRHPNPTASGGNDSNGVALYRNAQRVRIRGNTATGDSGDGVQCEGIEGTVRDVTIEGNIFNANSENAVDFKGSENVDIIRNLELADYLQPASMSPPRCGGGVVILHNSAPKISTKRVLVEGNTIHHGGIGILVGRKDDGWLPVEDVVIRHNYVYDITQEERNCGDGIRVHNVRRADIHYNTFDVIAHSGVMVDIRASDPQTAVAEGVHVSRNIFRDVKRVANPSHGIAEGGVLDFTVDRMSGLVSDYNSFFQPQGPPRFRNGSTGQLLTLEGGITWKTGLTTDQHSVGGSR